MNNYKIIASGDLAILIKDMDNGPTITNTAQAVLWDLNPAPGIRVFYLDTNGQLDELCHDWQTFKGFEVGPKDRIIAVSENHFVKV